MNRKKSPPVARDFAAPEGLEREIKILRELIHKAAARQNDDLSLEEQFELLDTIGKAAPALARLLKASRDLANQDLDPAALLRQALLELEEEWPELKKFGEKFKTKPAGEKPAKMRALKPPNPALPPSDSPLSTRTS